MSVPTSPKSMDCRCHEPVEDLGTQQFFLYTHHTFCFFDCGSLPQLVGRDGVGCELVQRNTESHLFAVIEQIFQHIAGWWLQTFAMINYHVDYTHIYI